jgi:hypothetical protein
MEISSSKLTLVKTPLIGIKGSDVPVKSALELLIIMGTLPRCVLLQQNFMVIDIALAYNVILGRPMLHQINIVINTRYLALKFPT